MKHILLIIFGGMLLFQSCRNAPIQLFTAKEVQTSKDVTLLDIDEKQLHNLRIDNAENVEIVVPFGGKTVTLELKQQELFTPDFKIMTDKGQASFMPGIYYEGKIRGNDESMVTLNIQGDEVSGIISTAEGDLNLGKANDVYALSDPGQMDFVCETPEGGIDAKEIELLQQQTHSDVQVNAVNTCVSVDFEMSYSNFQQFGSAAAVTNWITSIFASVKTVYANEGINIVIKSIYVWTTPDGYDPNPSTALNQLRAKRTNDPNFTASVTHLVRGKTSGFSGIAYVGVTCVDQYNAGVSDVQFGYNPYPTYSWTVMVLCHEMGHNFGSAHTHSCNWLHTDGTRHAIDGCGPTAGYSEGSCPIAPIPAKGTVMSYCQLLSNVGISLPLGFGPLPGNAIRAHIGATTCANCGTPPPPPPPVDLCKNGKLDPGEQGIDCGGVCPTVCPPAPPVGDPLISKGKPIIQSTNYNTYNSYPATKANDGMTGGANFSHTALELQPFIQIDLGGTFKVSKITIVNRADCCKDRIKRFKLFVSASPITGYTTTGHVYEFNSSTPFSSLDIPITGTGRYVKMICLNSPANYLHVSEISVYGVPSTTPPCVWRDTIYRVLRDSVGQVCR